MTTTLSVLARKGGVGRTTIVVSLAGEFRRRGARVLCLDLDGQASLSRVFFGSEKVESLEPTRTSAAVIAGYGSEPTEVIHETPLAGVWVVPASDTLERLATPEIGEQGNTVRNLVASVAEEYDVVLIDTPPNTNVATTWSGVVASDFVISPVPADSFGTQSIISVQRTVGEAVRVNPGLRLLGYVLNQVQHSKINDAYIRMVRQLHGGQVFKTEVPLAVAFREAVAMRRPICEHSPRCKGARAIASLADEINDRIESIRERAAA